MQIMVCVLGMALCLYAASNRCSAILKVASSICTIKLRSLYAAQQTYLCHVLHQQTANFQDERNTEGLPTQSNWLFELVFIDEWKPRKVVNIFSTGILSDFHVYVQGKLSHSSGSWSPLINAYQ